MENWLAWLGTACIMDRLLGETAELLLQNLWRILPAGDFQDIFRQIDGADVSAPRLVLTPLCLLLFWGVSRLRRMGWRIFARVMGVLLLLLGTLWTTAVNGVWFGDVAASLIPLLMRGVL